MELSDPKIKNFLTFSEKKLLLHFRKRNFLVLSLKNFRSELSELEK